MNTSILRRILVSANQGESADGKLWIMPVILELFALPFAWISVQMLHDHEPWGAIAEYALTGIVLGIAGVVWAVFRRRIAEVWPWHQLRVVRAEIARVEQENAETRKRLGLNKPQHNVQCVGFKYIECEPFKIAALRFQNVPVPGKLMGKFEWPRLRVIFYENSTGQEIADLAPVQWWDDKDGIMDISAEGRDADIASYFEGKWTASETYSDEHTLQPRLHSVDLPAGDIRIIAILSGQHGALPVPQVTGILTLGEDGTASFQRMSD